METIKNLTRRPSIDDVAKKGLEQLKKREESTFGFTFTDACAITKSCIAKTLTDEEIYNLTSTIQDKDDIISELDEQIRLKDEIADELFQKNEENHKAFELEKEELTKQIENYQKEVEASITILKDRDNSISEWEEKYQNLTDEHQEFKKGHFENIARINEKQKLESKEAKQLIEELERCLEKQIKAKEKAENKLSELTSPATPDHTQKSPIVRLRGFSGSFDEKMKLLEQKNQEAYNDLKIERNYLERLLAEEREKTEINKNTSQNVIKKLKNELKKANKKSNDLESDLKSVVKLLNQNWRTIQQEKEINSFLQIRLSQAKLQNEATFSQFLEQETKKQELEDEFTQRISGLDSEIDDWKKNYEQLSIENKEKQEKLEETEKGLEDLQLFHSRLRQDYKKIFSAHKNLELAYRVVFSELRRIKEERPDITIAEYNKSKGLIKKLKQVRESLRKVLSGKINEIKVKSQEIQRLKEEIAEKETRNLDLTQENSNLQASLTNQQEEINDLTTDLTNITEQRNLLQTEKDNLNTSHQTLQSNYTNLETNLTNIQTERDNLQNDYTNLETTFNTLQVEKNNLQVELQTKNSELNSQRINLALEKEQESKRILETIINELGIKVEQITTEEVIAEIKNLLTPPNPHDDLISAKDKEINELKSEVMAMQTNWKPKNDLVEIHPFWLSFIIAFPFFLVLAYFIIQKNKKLLKRYFKKD